MSVSILEALQNAEYNLDFSNPMLCSLGKGQLHNAVQLLLKGYSLDDQVEPLLEKYGHAEDVPEKD